MEEGIRFGDYVKSKRHEDFRELTLKDVSEMLGISLTLLSDIESNRRKPFDSERIEIFAQELRLSEEEKTVMYDLAGRAKKEIPHDIEEIMMEGEIGKMARFALRQSNAGVIDEEDWKKFIRSIEKKGGKK
jgi:transcriptional regulator with XRE-family HTH domain